MVIVVKNPIFCQCRICKRSLGQEDPWRKAWLTHSSILVYRITWTEEPGGLWSMGFKESDTTEAA